MNKYFKQDAVKTLNSARGTLTESWNSLLNLVQTASALSFAVRAPALYGERRRRCHMELMDAPVYMAKEVIGRDGVRPSMHSILHYLEAVNNH
ncbi:unnamed protein product, partial [Ectocarpus sp. 13 AM-2016]